MHNKSNLKCLGRGVDLEKQVLYYDEIETPVGTLSLLSNGKHALRIDYDDFTSNQEKWTKWTERYIGDVEFHQNSAPFKWIAEELQAYFLGEKKEFTFDFKLIGTSFQKQVWQALTDTIPFGETKSYKDIAVSIGNPKAVRAVGGAVNKNPFSIVVPCHRVIGTNGKMVGYGGGLDRKEYLLAFEKKNR